MHEDRKQREINNMGLPEIELDTTSPNVKNILFQQAKKIFSHLILQSTSSPIGSESFHRPGGTISLVQGSMVGRKIDSGVDALGRWT
eukprot:11059742-Ditylum_brightwellii.AAC.1